MPNLSAFGLSVTTPAGWDGEIYLPQGAGAPDALGAAAFGEPGGVVPILHVANFALPTLRGDYGGGAVELMGPDDLFVSLLEHPAEEAAAVLFVRRELPWPLTADDFSPQVMQRRLAGQAGCQRFFTHLGRPFCLYVAIGSYRERARLVPLVNDVLAAVRFS